MHEGDAKALLRRRFLARRRQLDRDEWRRMSDAITEQVMRLPYYRNCPVLLTYVSAKDNEADTCALIDHALRDKKKVLIPVMGKERGVMEWSWLKHRDELTPVCFGLLEPDRPYRRMSEPPQDAVCIVPGIAFTPEGGRIGYGGGYYDRFLTTFQGTTIGIAFDMQITPTLPVAPHDVRVMYVVTNTSCYHTMPPPSC